MEVLLEEARESYAEEIVIELQSDKLEQIESNVERIQQWIQQWKRDNSDDPATESKDDDASQSP